MRALSFPKARNRMVLRKLVSIHGLSVVDSGAIANQYVMYLSHNGNPSVVNPVVGLAETTEGLLKKRYKASAKKDGLAWIANLRSKHRLAYCPMCGNTGSKTLEHYLPKKIYPEFYLFSFNLIPSCSTCNQKRGVHANNPGTALPLLHPYFDGATLDLAFLETEIVPPFDAPLFRPTVNSLLAAGPIRDRALEHVTKSIEDESFTTWATSQWAELKLDAHSQPSLNSLLDDISRKLSNQVRVNGPNGWTAAFLRGLLSNHPAADWLRLNP